MSEVEVISLDDILATLPAFRPKDVDLLDFRAYQAFIAEDPGVCVPREHQWRYDRIGVAAGERDGIESWSHALDKGLVDYNDQYLRSRAWRYRSHCRKVRDDERCCRCGAQSRAAFDNGPPLTTKVVFLEVHHLTYESRGHETLDQLRTLCKACHASVHNKPSPEELRVNSPWPDDDWKDLTEYSATDLWGGEVPPEG